MTERCKILTSNILEDQIYTHRAKVHLYIDAHNQPVFKQHVKGFAREWKINNDDLIHIDTMIINIVIVSK